MWKEVLLCLCGVTAWVMASPAVPASHREKRAVPAFVASAAKDVGGKVVEALGDRIAEGVVENHQEKVIGSLEDYFSGQFDKADEEFDDVLARGGVLLAGVGGGIEEARVKVIHGRGTNTGDTYSPAGYELRMEFDREDDDDDEGNDDSSDGMSPAIYPMGVGPMLMNGCFGTGYEIGDPCYDAFVPLEACANIIDGATFLGTGFDGRGEYSTDSRKKSLIQRACEGLQGYKEYHVPDIMTVQGIYETAAETAAFGSLDEYRHYLEDKSAVTSAKAMFQGEMNKASGHGGGGGAFGLVFSVGGGSSSQSGSDRQTSSLQANSQASAQLTETSTRTFMAMMEINVFRYEIFLDFVGPENLNLAFLRDFLNLPGTYFAIAADKEFQKFILRWGTHYITSAKFGGQLKIIKTKEASFEDSKQTFVTAAQSDFKKLFSTYSAQQTQTKSSSWWHEHETKKETSSSTGEATSGTATSESSSDTAATSEYEFSNEVLEVQGGDQNIAAAITEFYTTSFGTSLKDWLESIEEYPKPFEFRMLTITDLLDMNFDSFFPHGVVDFGCFGRKTLSEDGKGRKYYVEDMADGNTTKSEIRYCDFEEKSGIEQSITERRLALKRAIAVYLEEGPLLSSDFQIPAGEPGCETAELVFLDDSINGAPSWQEMISGQEFKVVFDMPFNIARFLTASAALLVRFMSRTNKWLTIREGHAPRQFDGHRNGNSGDVTQHKVSVGGLVMTYDEDTGMFTVTQEDFDASAAAILDLPSWINGMDVGRAEYKSLLDHLSHQQSSSGGQMPCNLQWSNSHRIDPTDGGKCIHFTAASEGDIFLVFAGVPKDHQTWVTVEISTSGVAMYKALRLAVTQLDKGAKGLGSDTLYQSYFVCVAEDVTESLTTVQFGKTPDNEERGHVWLDYQFPEVLSLHYYAFGSGEHPVKLMGVSQIFKPTDLNVVCREGTVKEGDRCVQVCHVECSGCRTTGSDDPRDCLSCQNVRIAYPYIAGSVGDFECVSACPENMALAPGTNNCQCIKRMEGTPPDGTVTCVADCPLTHFDDDGVCKRCSSLCSDVSGDGRAVCTGPAADECTVCVYTAADGSCLEGCSPGQKAVAGSTTSEWKQIDGGLKFVSVGRAGVWSVSSNDQIYYRRGTAGNEASPGTEWVHVSGGLKQISSGDGEVWGVNSNDDIFIRQGISSSSPEGSSWHKIAGSLKQVHVSSTSNQVWGVDSTDQIYRRTGITASNPAGTEWEHIEGQQLKFVSVGRAGVWGVDSNDHIYYRTGTAGNEASPGTEWVQVSGGLKQVTSGDGEVWGVNGNDMVYVRQGLTAATPEGTSWLQIEGDLKEVYVSSSSNQVWGVDAADNIYRRVGIEQNTGDTLTCEPCRPGYKCVNGDEVEELCTAGTYSRADGTACDPCAVGEFSYSGASACELCPAGQHSTQSGSASCDPCPAGQYSSSGASTCQLCPVGQYSSSGASACQLCPAGQHNAQSGSASCDLCPAGQYSSSGASTCQLCPAGQHNTQGGSGSCDPCPAGQYISSEGSTSCQVCPAGKYSSQSGSGSCDSCPVEQVSTADRTSCTATEWRQIGGGLKFVSVGRSGVWGVNSGDMVYYRTGTYQNEASSGTDWVGIDGSLKQISSGNNIVWGVSSIDEILVREGMSSSSPEGSSWQQIAGGLKQVYVSSTSNQVWGVNSGDLVYRRAGINASNPAGTEWQQVEGQQLKFVSVGRAGVWGVNSNDQIYYRRGTAGNEASPGTEWVQVSGGLKQITSGDGQVWGVSVNNMVYVRQGLTAETPQGSSWLQIEGDLKEVYVSSSSNQIWGVDAADNIYRRVGIEQTTG
ncbi:uncharacterized protein [Branchiostoma lanceolatum]|uniref:uncharacterized protein n=1 Tax=Branchiostoma lanceolatum TaxID=7740 RepID=UPI003452E0E9